MWDKWEDAASAALRGAMSLDMANLYFNDPVDPDALGIPEYRQVVKKPMDLGTIRRKLEESKQGYATPHDVLRDVNLVWSNCKMFNAPESEVVEACDEVEYEFKSHWRRLGLHKWSAEKPKPAAPKEDPSAKKDGGRDAKKESEPVAKKSKKDRGSRSKSKTKKKKLPPMSTCLKLMKEFVKFKDAELFLAPVDPDALGIPDYFDVVEHPMDLGTILNNLQSGRIVGWENIVYKNPLDFKKDVDLVWSNCALYNDQPEDQWIRDICSLCTNEFARLWAEYGFAAYYEKPPKKKSADKAGEGGEASPAKSKSKKKSKSSRGDGDGKATKKRKVDEDYSPAKGGKDGGDKKKSSGSSKSKAAKESGDKSGSDPPAFAVKLTEEQVREIFDLKPNARCPVCKVQKKGSCGTETSPLRCYRRQFKGLEYTELSKEEMIKFATMVVMKQGASRPKKSKEEQRRMKLARQIEQKQAEADRSLTRVENAKQAVERLKVAIAALKEAEDEIEREERQSLAERDARAHFVPHDYQTKPLCIPENIMALGNHFWAMNSS